MFRVLVIYNFGKKLKIIIFKILQGLIPLYSAVYNSFLLDKYSVIR